MNSAATNLKASRTSVRLVCLAILLLARFASGEEFYQLHIDTLFSIPSPPANQGVAIAIGGSGESFVLLNPSGRIAIRDRSGKLKGEFDLNIAISNNPTDIASDGGTGLFICDPFQRVISHLSRNGTSLPAINLSKEANLEPVTITTLRDGRSLILNRQDGDIWRFERDGQAVPLLISPRVRNFDNARLEISPDEKRLILLENGKLRSFRIQGEALPSQKPTLANSKGIAATSEGVWLVGEAIEFIPFTPSFERLLFPSDSLKAWRIYPASDIAVNSDKVFILSANGALLLQMSLEKVATEHR